MQEDYKHKDLTAKVIGCAMEVHRTLGVGFLEVVYARALALELESSGVGFLREQEMPIIYKDKKIGERRVDFVVEGKIMLEIKAVSELENLHLVQAKNYLEAANFEVGLLINFGSKSLQFKRLLNTRYSENKIIH
jgi:GxxExxY protein